MTKAAKKKFVLYRLCGAVPALLLTVFFLRFSYVIGASVSLLHTSKGSPVWIITHIMHGGYMAVILFLILSVFCRNLPAAETMPFRACEPHRALFHIMSAMILILGIAEMCGLVWNMDIRFSLYAFAEAAEFEQGIQKEVFYQTANALAVYISMQLNICAAALLAGKAREFSRSVKNNLLERYPKWAALFIGISLLKMLAAMFAAPSAVYIVILSAVAVAATVLSAILSDRIVSNKSRRVTV